MLACGNMDTGCLGDVMLVFRETISLIYWPFSIRALTVWTDASVIGPLTEGVTLIGQRSEESKKLSSLTWLTLRTQLKRVHHCHPDGECCNSFGDTFMLFINDNLNYTAKNFTLKQKSCEPRMKRRPASSSCHHVQKHTSADTRWD